MFGDTHSLPEISSLKHGDHLCGIYETEEELWALLTPFLCLGLEQREKVTYIADAHSDEAILAYLSDKGLDIEACLSSGQLSILTSDEVYMGEGTFDPEAMVSFLRAETNKALAEGYSALRITGEGTWALQGLPSLAPLIEYEAIVNEFFAGSHCLALCRYDRRRFDPEVLSEVLRTHPIAVIGTEFYENFHYIPPAGLMRNNRANVDFRDRVNILADRKRDEEERRKLEVQLQEAQKLECLSLMAGSIAHKLNNLLTAILGNAELLLMEVPPTSPMPDMVKEIQTAVQQAKKLSRQMQIYSGGNVFALRAVDLNEQVTEMTLLLKKVISKTVLMKYNLAENLPAIKADAPQIPQVIMNLVVNASDAIGDSSGVITLTTGTAQVNRTNLSEALLGKDLPEGTYAYVEVSDTGVGMDDETKAKMFDPFFTTKFIGRGLGLAVVLGILRGHRGAIEVDSELGSGTVIRLLFPLADEPD